MESAAGPSNAVLVPLLEKSGVELSLNNVSFYFILLFFRKCLPSVLIFSLVMCDLQINEGDFVVVKYEFQDHVSKKKELCTRLYVGQVSAKFANKFLIQFMNSYYGSKVKFHFERDENNDYLRLSDIVRLLPQPELRRGVYTFQKEPL